MSDIKSALITGITGQDGSYLAELLLEKGYEVFGIIRRNSVPENQESRISHLSDKITTFYGDLLDKYSIDESIKRVKPDELYNLGAQSHVWVSSQIPEFTIKTNTLGVLNVLQSVKEFSPKTRVYQASSSECFGSSVDKDNYQRETTPMHPVSPYGVSKVASYHLIRHFRKAYKLFCSNGLLFNHSSYRHSKAFLLNKCASSAVLIKYGKQENLELGNMDSYRDFGHNKDYVRAMWMILNHTEPDDFVVATGKTYSVRDVCKIVFGKLGMNYENYVVQNPKYVRPEELPFLRGDSSKARKVLGWEPEISFEDNLQEMIDYWTKKLIKSA